MAREVEFADHFADIFRHVTKGRKFDGLEVIAVKRGYPVAGKEVDIALIAQAEPFVFIETKRKGVYSCFDSVVIGQAISYCALQKENVGQNVPYFITATPTSFAVFKTPNKPTEFVDLSKAEGREYDRAIKPGKLSQLFREHLIKSGELRLRDEFVASLLDELSKDYHKTHPIRVQLTPAIIAFFNDFVDAISTECKDLIKLEAETGSLKDELLRLEEETGSAFVKRDDENHVIDATDLARMMAYVLMNKLVFYKVLEEKYKNLPSLTTMGLRSATQYVEHLTRFFQDAVQVTNDFEAIFNVSIFDKIRLPDDPETLQFIDRFLTMLDNFDMAEIGELIGYAYENVIPAKERHQLGQFYTPPAIAELIAKWCVRGPDDIIIDPGVGSGTFATAAYRQLVKQKTGRDSLPVSGAVHEKILDQMYAMDVNPFPLQLASMTLAMKNVRTPSSAINTILADYFALAPGQTYLSPYTIRKLTGNERRQIIIPRVDCVIGNPPYTRWVEIPDKTQDSIRTTLGTTMRKYKLTPQVSRGVEPGIYTYWVMHSAEFLKEHGRLGMIVSNMWMQTDYGIGFGKFLLDNFKIKAIVDFTLRLFTALISACVILLEKTPDEHEREESEIVFISIPGQHESIEINKILSVIKQKKAPSAWHMRMIRQKDIPRDKKWVNTFFGDESIFTSPLLTKLGELFEPSYGNATYLYTVSTGKLGGVRNPGSSDFHYLSPSKLKEPPSGNSLTDHAYPTIKLEDEPLIWPAITSARQAQYFTFNQHDWQQLVKNDERCYMFIGHRRREELSNNVRKYLVWGETECVTRIKETRGGGRLASETESAKVRAKTKEYYGWYDLGGVKKTPIFAIRQAWWKSRFTQCAFPVAMYDALIALIPKTPMRMIETKALLAYLNSSFVQYYIETRGRRSGGGIIGFEVNIAQDMPVPDVRNLSQKQRQLLARKFDELEVKTREIGGASEKKQIEQLRPKIHALDQAIASILNLTRKQVKGIQDMADFLIERRVSGAKEVRPGSVSGEYDLKMQMPKGRVMKKLKHRLSASIGTARLEKFLGK